MSVPLVLNFWPSLHAHPSYTTDMSLHTVTTPCLQAHPCVKKSYGICLLQFVRWTPLLMYITAFNTPPKPLHVRVWVCLNELTSSSWWPVIVYLTSATWVHPCWLIFKSYLWTKDWCMLNLYEKHLILCQDRKWSAQFLVGIRSHSCVSALLWYSMVPNV